MKEWPGVKGDGQRAEEQGYRNRYSNGNTTVYLISVLSTATTSESAFGASATASTLKFASSRRYDAVVGPIAAIRARRKGDDSSGIASEKYARNAGKACAAAEGAKKTIHHKSSSSSSSNQKKRSNSRATTLIFSVFPGPGASAQAMREKEKA